MSSIEEAISYMEKNGKIEMDNFRRLWIKLIRRLKECEFIEVNTHYEEKHDIGKLMISAHKAGIDGQTLHNLLLQRFSLQMEMAQGKYVLAMFTVADKADAYDRLADALITLDKEFKNSQIRPIGPTTKELPKALEGYAQIEKECDIYTAWDADIEWIDLEDSISRCAGEFVNLYPPGIPLVVPGEIFNHNLVNIIKGHCALGLPVQGINKVGDKVQVKVLKRK
jgi:arginine/lysine/ornithine decarboxylase